MSEFEIFQDTASEYRWRLLDENGRVVAASEGYATASSCRRSIERVRELAPQSLVDEKVLSGVRSGFLYNHDDKQEQARGWGTLPERNTRELSPNLYTQENLAQRLRMARTNVGLSQDEVAAELGVARPTVSQIEAGKRSVSSIELARLAGLYRRSLASFFDEDFEEALSEDPLTILFRANNLGPEDLRVVEEFEEFCRSYRDLEALLGLEDEKDPLPDYGGIGEPYNKLQAMRQGEKVAAEERRRLGLGDDPIKDVFELLESQGVRLFVRRLREGGISGLFLYSSEIGPCILINGSERPGRLAFDAVHEYAHVLLDRRLRAHASPSGRRPEEHEELLEVRANSFAAAFLMPAAGIKRFLWDLGVTHDGPRGELDVVDVLYLQRAFGVSYQATLYRLQNLGWLGRAKREALGERRPEALARALDLPEEPEADFDRFEEKRGYPLRYKYLVLEAYQQGKISLGKLAELLRYDLEDARALTWSLG